MRNVRCNRCQHALQKQDLESAKKALDAALTLVPEDWDRSRDFAKNHAIWLVAEQLATLGCEQANRDWHPATATSSDKNAGIGPLPLFILAVEKHIGRYGGIRKRS